MADLLPSRPDTSADEEADPRVIGLDSEDADDLLSALSSETAREVLATLHDEPDTPANVADRVDTSLQNAQYHLGNLKEAGLIEVADTVYSEKGREMKRYAPADRPLVVFAGREEESQGLESALKNLLGAVGILGVVSLLVQWYVDGPPFGAQTGGAADGGGGGMGTMSTEAAPTAADAAGGLPPGLLFFLGGLVALAVIGAVWYVRR
ncbi:ArsR/SmtB family transcription factor [Haloplanus aerogenes]|uniref:ArsR family transcriptional regulator n=1 Tax=Haloplanus aerogenes TaxID=660522 RepID=A0A3M0D9G0_9EURY|nr:helix-turn-helix domain-containing protein [Haloplanus aerogenes]AZH26207.1 ArsR family transcriptional regulator [Haloplanus aerogenes]RMB18341.1 DNA-binding transcriptional ArsR family regulator [Haloplanus aerogenes]